MLHIAWHAWFMQSQTQPAPQPESQGSFPALGNLMSSCRSRALKKALQKYQKNSTHFSKPVQAPFVLLLRFHFLPIGSKVILNLMQTSSCRCTASQLSFTLNSGHTIPAVGLGVYQAAHGDEAYDACLNALRMGYRHIDTAQIYRNEALKLQR